MRRAIRAGLLIVTCTFFGCGEVGTDVPTPDADRQAAQTAANASPQVEWTRTFGEQELAEARGVDAFGNVYVAGSVGFALPGQEDGFRTDGFVRKYDPQGNVVWTRQFDLGSAEDASGVAVDASGVYVTGETLDIVPGRGPLSQAYVRKYSIDGELLWTTEVGVDGRRVTRSLGIALDDTGVYISGETGTEAAPTIPAVDYDGFIARLSKQGSLQWTERVGASGAADALTGVDAGPAGVFVGGWTDGSLPGEASEGGRDAIVRRLQRNGEEIWTRQFGTSADDEATGVATLANSVYVAGWTDGTFFGQERVGARDGFVRRFRADGAELQTDQFGTSSGDQVAAIDASDGGVYLAGWTQGTFPNQDQQARITAFARRYEVNLDADWTLQFVVARNNFARAISVQPDGVYVAGTAETAQGATASFLVKIVEDGIEPPPTDCEVIDEDVVIDDPRDLGRFVAIEGCFEITGGLFIQNVRDVYDLEFLSGLRSVGGFVGIADNPQLESLAGLETLEFVGEGLVIEGNPNLVSVIEASSIEQIDGVFHIFGNPQLPTCQAEALLAAIGRANIAGQVIIAGNDDEGLCQ